jgi:hypothetical protein
METKMSSKVRKSTGHLRHQKAWISMRILKQWTIPGVVCTIEGATVNSISKFVASLERHGIVEKIPGYKKDRVGEHQQYRIYPKLASEPTYPQVCALCDQVISAKVCDPSVRERHKETDREGEKESSRNKRAETMRARFAALPPLTESELAQAEAELWPKKERETETPKEIETAAADYPNKGWHVLPGALKRRITGGLHDAT